MGPMTFGVSDEPLNYDDTGLLEEIGVEEISAFALETGLSLVPTDERYD